MSRPWNIWWDFRREYDEIKWVVIQTDHPKYAEIDYIRRYPVEECIMFDSIDDWVECVFDTIKDNLLSGRISLHDYVKGHKGFD